MIRCACCNKKIGSSSTFCSIECACCSGRYSVTKGWINEDQPIKRCPPKQPWWMLDEDYEEWIGELGWKLQDGSWVLN
jgi:hypothetical protein